MKVFWVQDLEPLSTGGGAQLTDREIILEGVRKQHDIRVIAPDMPLEFEGADLVVLSNFVVFPPNRLADLLEPCRYVVFHHDYVGQCRYRLHYPRSEKCLTKCPIYPIGRRIFSKAELNIFLSPLHYEMHKERFQEDIEPHALIPCCVDVRKCFDMGQPRFGTCAVNALLPFKGRENLIKYAKEHPEEPISVAGENPTADALPENVRFIGSLLPDGMNEFYNAHKRFVHLPQTPQPAERTAVEAYLAGCEIYANKLVGVLSYPWFTSRERVRREISRAPRSFWREVEKL